MKHLYKITFACLLAVGVIYSCKKAASSAAGSDDEETATSGSTTILVDNSIQPIVEDVLAVFHSIYDRAHVTQVNKTENEIINALMQDSAKVAVLPRLLTKEEEARFTKKGVTPQITFFATDAIALITNKSATDTIINSEDVLMVLQSKETAKGYKLVFDNPNSSTMQYLLKLAGVKQIPAKNVYAVKTSEEVIKYVHDTPGAIGIVGVNWLVQPPTDLLTYVENIRVLAVNSVKIDKGVKKYYKPTQSNIATGLYPLTRKLYVLNYRGSDGLGMGFATYIGAHEGQRIILKSGLMPATIPTREIEVRSEL
jgi:phosphate transport system substrate-binding protein